MKRKNIVALDGGTGLSTLLEGLKKYPWDIYAIVTMTDDGGSSGILQDEFGVLPSGDIICRGRFNFRFKFVKTRFTKISQSDLEDCK